MEEIIRQLILEYLAEKTFVSLGEIAQICLVKFPDKVNKVIFLKVHACILNLIEESLIEVKEVENHLWVKEKINADN